MFFFFFYGSKLKVIGWLPICEVYVAFDDNLRRFDTLAHWLDWVDWVADSKKEKETPDNLVE